MQEKFSGDEYIDDILNIDIFFYLEDYLEFTDFDENSYIVGCIRCITDTDWNELKILNLIVKPLVSSASCIKHTAQQVLASDFINSTDSSFCLSSKLMKLKIRMEKKVFVKLRLLYFVLLRLHFFKCIYIK